MRLADVRTDSRGYRGAVENPDDILSRLLPITLGPNTHQRGMGHQPPQGETPDQRGVHQARHLNYGGMETLGGGSKTIDRSRGGA